MNEEIDKLKKLERIKNDARSETEQKIDEVDSKNGIDSTHNEGETPQDL